MIERDVHDVVLRTVEIVPGFPETVGYPGLRVADYRIHTGPEMPDPVRERLMAWLIANGLDPTRIPGVGTITVLDGQVTATEYIQTEAGTWLKTPDGTGTAIRERTVPLVEPWPDDNFGLGAP